MKRDLNDLVTRAQKGDEAAWAALYEETAEAMLGRARSMVKSDQDALDLLQDSYLEAFRSLDRLENPAYFKTWLYRIVTNRCLNFLKRSKPRLFEVSLTDEEGEELEKEDLDITFRPDESLDYSETKRHVRQLVDSLPDDQRMCILLSYFQEMKVSEIAKALGVSENTVKSRLSYGRKKIERGVLELEKQGVNLRGVAVFPFLRWAMGESTRTLAVSSVQTLLPGLLGALSQGAAAAGTAAGTAAGSAAAGTAAGTAAGSAAAGTAAGTAAGSAAAGTAAGTAGSAAAGTAATASAVAKGGFLATVGAKVGAGIAAAVVLVGGGFAVANLTGGQEEPVPVREEAPLDPGEGYALRQRLTDPSGTLDPEEFYVELAVTEPAVLEEYHPETQEIYISVPVNTDFTLELRPSFQAQAAELVPYNMYGDAITSYWPLEERGVEPTWGNSTFTTSNGVENHYGPVSDVAQSGDVSDMEAGFSQTIQMIRKGAIYYQGDWEIQTPEGSVRIEPKIYIYGRVKEGNPISFQIDIPSLINSETQFTTVAVSEPAQVTGYDLQEQTVDITCHVGDVFEIGSPSSIQRKVPTLEELKAQYAPADTDESRYLGGMGGGGWYFDESDPRSEGSDSLYLRTEGADYAFELPEGAEYCDVVEMISLDGSTLGSQIRAIGPGVVCNTVWSVQNASSDAPPEIAAKASQYNIVYRITVLP